METHFSMSCKGTIEQAWKDDPFFSMGKAKVISGIKKPEHLKTQGSVKTRDALCSL